MTLEMARSFQQGGHDDDAQAVRCSSKYAENAPSCVRLKQLKEFQGQRAQLMQDDRPKSGKVNIVSGAYLETTDSVTGFKTVVDTRDSYRR